MGRNVFNKISKKQIQYGDVNGCGYTQIKNSFSLKDTTSSNWTEKSESRERAGAIFN